MNRPLHDALEQLKRTQERLDIVQELTQMGIWHLEFATGDSVWSGTVLDGSGLEKAENDPNFERFFAAVHPDDREDVRRRLTAAIEGRTDYEAEYRFQKADGSIRWLFSRGRALYDADGNPERILGIDVDVTDRHAAEEEKRNLEQQLRQVQKMEAIGQLAGGIAHDFNNLLLALRGYGDLALRALARGDDATGEVREMLSAADRAKALTRQLLAFSRRQLLQPRIVDLNVVVSEMEKLLARLIDEDVVLTTAPSRDPVWVNADQGQLEQVLANLAVNARDAMPEGGMLRVEVSSVDVAWHDAGVEPGAYALLSVSDTGSGMDSETAAQIFEPFFTTKESVGTGLGLATVHGIVKQSGGHIWVYSELGYGTTFKIYLPLVDAQAPSRGAPIIPAVGGAETIMLIEDDAAVRTIVKQMLTERGYDVIPAMTGEEAVRIGRTIESVDLVLTDIVMPGMNGRQTADRLRELHPGISILYMSGYTDDAVVRRGVLTAGTAFIQKPFTGEELAHKVRDALDDAKPAKASNGHHAQSRS